MTSRHYCFTAWQQPQYDETKVRYMCYAKETAPKTGKLHYQGYIEYYDAHRFPGAKAILGDPTANLSVRKGTKEQAIAYCRGDYTTTDGRYKPLNDVFIEYGALDKKRPAKGVEVSITNPPTRPMRHCYICSRPSHTEACGSCHYDMCRPESGGHMI